MRLAMRLAMPCAVLALAACARDVRPTAPHPPPVLAPDEVTSADPPEVTFGRGTVGDLEALCSKTHPECRHAFLRLVGPPSPCANRGALCPPELITRWKPRWACACEACGGDSDCAPDERCSAAEVGCPPQRVARRCERGPRGALAPRPLCIPPP